MSAVTFWVPGTPKPQGSMRAFNNPKAPSRPFVVADNKATKPWRAEIAGIAQAEGVRPVQGPVGVQVIFFMPRPQAHFLRDGLRANAPDYVSKKPDADKLARAVLDALTGIAWNDDAQVSTLYVRKVYTPADHGPGARITIRPEEAP